MELMLPICVMLWDGAFSYASKVDPSHEDISMNKRFVMFAVYSHVDVGCNITPKVHLMWKHAARQIGFPGGLGQKREDWVEHGHQITAQLRQHFRTTKDKGVRADAMTRLRHQGTHHDVMEHMDIVDDDACLGPKEGCIIKEDKRKVKREKTR